jgi:hypothetical protein
MPTTLVVPLPAAVGCGESIAVELHFRFRLPPKQGRWGQWAGVTYLSNWLPVLAVYDEQGWHPVPYIPWHQPWFNEAGIYSARVTLPADQVLASTGSVRGCVELGDGWKQVEIGPVPARDFALLCSSRYQEFCGNVGPVRVRVVAFPEHAHYAQVMVRVACEAIDTYSRWIGPYPYPEFTIAESYFGWNGNECSGLVMIDERVFAMPHLAENYVDYLVSHEICHQWFYNVIGTNGYCETWMDEGLATYLSHRLENLKHGKNNPILKYPGGLEWLPNIHRENYRYYGLFGTYGRGEMGPTVQPIDKFGHVVNLFTMAYDKGSRLVGMIEDRLGEAAFLDFLHIIYCRYHFRILRVCDFQRELEEYTGSSWEEFFRNWVYGAGLCDWAVTKVKVYPQGEHRCQHPQAAGCRVSVLLEQKADIAEQTVLGVRLDDGDGWQMRIPILPQVPYLELDDPPATVRWRSEREVEVEMTLPCKPTQIGVDPDRVLVDCEPTNILWKPGCRFRFTPLYTMLEETDLTNDYHRWNFICGPWMYGQTYNDPWFTRTNEFGLRAGVYRTQRFSGGGYLVYRTDYQDIAVGVDAFRDHWPFAKTQVGFCAEYSLTQFDDEDACNRGVLYGRYVLTYGSSLYLPPFQYVEAFASIQDNALPEPDTFVFGAKRFNNQTTLGLHYHLNYLTPYWDPEGGIKFDATFANGLPVRGNDQVFNNLSAQLSTVKYLSFLPGDWLSATRLAARLYGGIAWPTDGEFFTLGGSMLFRGYSIAQRQGSRVWVASLEWRLPLCREVAWDCCDHCVGVRNVYLVPFYDAGAIYVRGETVGNLAHAVGAGLRVDLAWFSMIERTVMRLDAAKTVNDNTPWQFWFGVQHPF